MKHIFYLHLKTNALLSDKLLEDMGPQMLRESIELGVYRKIELTERQASEYSVLGLEDE